MVGDIKFVHYDLFPWNIMLQRKTIDVQYRTISVKTDIVPVIIDYGRSQVSNFGYMAPPLEKLEYSHFQDILSLVLSSLSSILHVKYKSDRWYQIGRDKDVYINLMNICTGKCFCTIREIKRYCKYEKNLSLLLLREKRENELLPIEFFNRLSKFSSKWKKQLLEPDLRRNSFALYKNLCNEDYDICKAFLKKTLPVRTEKENRYIYKSCIVTLAEYKDNILYNQCIKKLNKIYKNKLINENE